MLSRVWPGVRSAVIRERADRERVAVANGVEGIRDPILLREVERRTGLLGQEAGAAEVVGVDVGIEDVGDVPAVLRREFLIDRGWQGRIDHRRLAAIANQVGETALSRCGAPE